jgi:hypothetical protein
MILLMNLGFVKFFFFRDFDWSAGLLSFIVLKGVGFLLLLFYENVFVQSNKEVLLKNRGLGFRDIFFSLLLYDFICVLFCILLCLQLPD